MSTGISLELPVGIDPQEAHDLDISQRKLSISDDDVRNYFTEAFRVADEIRTPRELIWRSCWDLYNGKYEWGEKAQWQAKINIPKVRGVVDKATATIKRALTKMKRFYQVESETKLGIEKGLFTMSLMDYYLDQISFVEAFAEGLKSGLITSTLIYKIWWNWERCEEPRWKEVLQKEPIFELGIKVGEQLIPMQQLVKESYVKGMLGLRPVDPFNFWVGPRDSFRIEKSVVDLAYLYELADKGIYNREAVEELSARSGSRIEQTLEAERRGEHIASPHKYIREVELYHYWGDIYGDDGKLKAKNATFTIGDKDVVLRKPEKNPFFHGRDPYIVGTPYIVPFSTYHRGIVEDILGIARMITELSCLIIDGAQFDAMQAYEADVDKVDDPRQLKQGIYPGKMYGVKGFENPDGKQVIRPIATGKIPQLALQVLRFLDTEEQLATNVTNAQRGGTISGIDTATEFQAVVGSANESLDDAARTVEETTLDDLLEKVAKTIYQYHEDYNLSRLTENFPQTSLMLAQMEPEERYATMVGGFHFKARGVSIFLDKAQDLQKVMRFVELISNIPGILTRINIDDMLEQIIVAMGWNPAKILLNPSSQPVVPPAVLGGNPLPVGPGGAPQMNPSQLTPAQMMAGQQGAMMGGGRNNPMANPNIGPGMQTPSGGGYG